MNEELAVSALLYKKRNKYLTEAMEDLSPVAVGDEAFQKVRSNGRKRIRRRKVRIRRGINNAKRRTCD